MGGGIAKEAARRYPSLPGEYANLIRLFGHHVYLLSPFGFGNFSPRPLLMFPTKNEVWQGSSLGWIGQSLEETVSLANIYGWQTIALPRPGAGLGGLDWHSEVKPFLLGFELDDRFLIVSYPSEGR